MVGVVGSSPIAPTRTSGNRPSRQAPALTEPGRNRSGIEEGSGYDTANAQRGQLDRARVRTPRVRKSAARPHFFSPIGATHARTSACPTVPSSRSTRRSPSPKSPRRSAPASPRPRSPARSTASSSTPRTVIDARRRRRHRHRQGSRGPRRHPPLDRAPARLRGEGALPRCAGDHRPGDRGRLLLRLLVQAAVHARGPRRDRGARWPSSRRRTSRSRAG